MPNCSDCGIMRPLLQGLNKPSQCCWLCTDDFVEKELDEQGRPRLAVTLFVARGAASVSTPSLRADSFFGNPATDQSAIFSFTVTADRRQ